ncbi:hypothetical protein SNEBB_008734 [Seison nebaliae]|nr:hypothetical protein SNEBB_008734 [Seison nebaliae]
MNCIFNHNNDDEDDVSESRMIETSNNHLNVEEENHCRTKMSSSPLVSRKRKTTAKYDERKSEEIHRNKPKETSMEIKFDAKDQLTRKELSGKYLELYFTTLFFPSDNKLTMKLFGNRNALLKEKMRQENVGHWIIHPCSNFRFYWDLLMLGLLMANLIILPVAISFFNDRHYPTKWLTFNIFSDSFFILDVVVNFRTGILTNDYAEEIILEPKAIANHYLRTWFVIDMLSSLPLDYIFIIFEDTDTNSSYVKTGRAFKVLRLTKLISLLKLLRVSRLIRYVRQWEEFLSVAGMVMRILNLVCLILLLGHWNGCLQFLVPMLQDYPEDSWVILDNIKDETWFIQYTHSLFKALSHMLSIGYGKNAPRTNSDMWMTVLSMMLGATCYAIMIGHVSALIHSFDASKRMYNEKYKQVEEYMAWRKLPRAMRKRIRDYYEHRYQGKMFDEENILNEISERLREDVLNYNCRSLVANVPFFANADPNFVSDVVNKLRYEVYQPCDIIVKEGTIGTKMYFIQEGVVDVLKSDGEVFTSLSDGSYFGEICLLTRARRTASVQAVTYCHLFSLSIENFNIVLDQYPLMRRTIECVAAERLTKLGKNPNVINSSEDLRKDQELMNEIIEQNSDEARNLISNYLDVMPMKRMFVDENLEDYLNGAVNADSTSTQFSRHPPKMQTSFALTSPDSSSIRAFKRPTVDSKIINRTGSFLRSKKLFIPKQTHAFSEDDLSIPYIDSDASSFEGSCRNSLAPNRLSSSLSVDFLHRLSEKKRQNNSKKNKSLKTCRYHEQTKIQELRNSLKISRQSLFNHFRTISESYKIRKTLVQTNSEKNLLKPAVQDEITSHLSPFQNSGIANVFRSSVFHKIGDVITAPRYALKKSKPYSKPVLLRNETKQLTSMDKISVYKNCLNPYDKFVSDSHKSNLRRDDNSMISMAKDDVLSIRNCYRRSTEYTMPSQRSSGLSNTSDLIDNQSIFQTKSSLSDQTLNDDDIEMNPKDSVGSKHSEKKNLFRKTMSKILPMIKHKKLLKENDSSSKKSSIASLTRQNSIIIKQSSQSTISSHHRNEKCPNPIITIENEEVDLNKDDHQLNGKCRQSMIGPLNKFRNIVRSVGSNSAILEEHKTDVVELDLENNQSLFSGDVGRRLTISEKLKSRKIGSTLFKTPKNQPLQATVDAQGVYQRKLRSTEDPAMLFHMLLTPDEISAESEMQQRQQLLQCNLPFLQLARNTSFNSSNNLNELNENSSVKLEDGTLSPKFQSFRQSKFNVNDENESMIQQPLIHTSNNELSNFQNFTDKFDESDSNYNKLTQTNLNRCFRVPSVRIQTNSTTQHYDNLFQNPSSKRPAAENILTTALQNRLKDAIDIVEPKSLGEKKQFATIARNILRKQKTNYLGVQETE